MPKRMLTTIDNPYNPYTHFDEWNAYDVAMGYNTCAYLARIANNSFELSEADQDLEVQSAIDEIVGYNILGIYKTIESE